MPLEIERKFLVINDAWRASASEGVPFQQGYILTRGGVTVRVRTAGDQGYITIKGQRSGITRSEFEYPICWEEAQEMLEQLCDPPIVEKTRYFVQIDGATWEVDEFRGDNLGLIVAEIELKDEAQQITLPHWVGIEVSDDPRYTNLQLSAHPFGAWHDKA